MGEVDRFAEAAAVHLRIRDPEDQGDNGEEHHQDGGDDRRRLAEHAADERRAGRGLHEGQDHPEGLRGSLQEAQVEELEIFADDEAGAHRIQQLEQARGEEHQADEDGAETPESMMCLFHTR